MIGWLLNFVYAVVLVAASPILVWRMLTQGKYRDGWSEKFLGRLPESFEGEQVIWLHAVSVGEVLQLRTFVAELRGHSPWSTIVITTTTITGRAVAEQTFPECRIAYCPLDFTWSVREALHRLQPTMIGLVELELWPNLIREAASAGVPLMLINGRISQRSHRGYLRIRPLMRSLLQRLDVIAVQSEAYAQRLIDLGAPVELVQVTGSIKFDGVNIDGLAEATSDLRSAFGIGAEERVLVAGSTHDPEEQIALQAWQQVRHECPDLRLLIVPRHKERFDDVAEIITQQGLPLVRRSCPDATTVANRESVLLLDTLGDLSACWGLADVAFVGGSLTRRGGQNMIEPAAWGVPVIVGPNTSNFRDVVEGLQSVEAINIITSGEDLGPAVVKLLDDKLEATRQGQAARNFVHAQQGATRRTLDLAIALLEPTTHAAINRAA